MKFENAAQKQQSCQPTFNDITCYILDTSSVNRMMSFQRQHPSQQHALAGPATSVRSPIVCNTGSIIRSASTLILPWTVTLKVQLFTTVMKLTCPFIRYIRYMYEKQGHCFGTLPLPFFTALDIMDKLNLRMVMPTTTHCQ